MKSIDIKGKEYFPVNERIIQFRKEHPLWTVETEIKEFGDVVLMKATVKDETGRVVSTGHAYERENSTFINKTSFVENCETSAVGRALGLLGIGIETSIASFEEVANAVVQQEQPADERPWLNAKQLEAALLRIRTLDTGDLTPEQFVQKIKDEYRMKKEFRKSLEEELTSKFNEALNGTIR